MNKQEATAKAKPFFDNYPGVNEFHITSDGKAFFNKPAAATHGRTLEDKDVLSVFRNEKSVAPDKEIKNDNNAAGADDAKAAAKAEKQAAKAAAKAEKQAAKAAANGQLEKTEQ